MTAPEWQGPVGVVGLGLIGGSLGLDLQARGLEVRALVHRPSTAERARERGLAAVVHTDPAVLRDCSLVVLALPLDRLMEPPAELVAALPPKAVVTDVGSVKAPVLARWRSLHPRFVASHPMAGTAEAGVEAGVGGLFVGRPWVATPEASTDPQALATVQMLAELVGAHWCTCAASAHDQAVALISHLPVLVSAALLQTPDRFAQATDQGADSGMAALVRLLASSGFADTTRVGGGNPALGTLMARWNRDAVLAALEQYLQVVEQLRGLVRSADWDQLQVQLTQAQVLRPGFMAPQGCVGEAEAPSTGRE